MKIISEGNTSKKNWWVGKTITCEHCQRKIELELSDANLSCISLSPDIISYTCEICNYTTSLQVQIQPTLLMEQQAPQAPQNTQAAPLNNPTVTPREHSTAAAVGGVSSPGWSNPFKGTSWGQP